MGNLRRHRSGNAVGTPRIPRYLMVAAAWFFGPAAGASPDLLVALRGADTALPGSDVGSKLNVVVYNGGSSVAPGTDSSDRGYMVDLFLTRGPRPGGYARYSETYFDGVLLRGGRFSNTRDIPPGRREAYNSSASIPSDTAPGTYQLCARVDPGNKLKESNESNNTTCVDLEVVPPRVRMPETRWKALRVVPGDIQLRPYEVTIVGADRNPVEPPKPAGDGSAERTVLADGTLVISYPDGSKRSLLPDGTTVFTTPEGLEMVPRAMQVQGAELPELPEGLSDWGSQLTDGLGGILTNILTEAEMEAYLQTETDKDYYDLVDWRIRSIRFLTAQDTLE